LALRGQHDHGHATMNERKVRLPLQRFLGSMKMSSPMKMIAIVVAFVWATTVMIPGQQLPGQQINAGSGLAAKVRDLEYARFDAQHRKDNLALDAMFDNALVWVEPDGVQLTKADYLAKLRKPDINVTEINPESMTVRAHGTTAVVVGIYRERGVKDGQAYALRARFMDTWAFKNGKWLCIAAAATSSIS
jgi:ketosteroid isomerase-like protein